MLRHKVFDMCIVDEAGQITLPACVGPLLRARAFTLVGDDYQLGPLVQRKAAAEAGLKESLFSILCRAFPQAGCPPTGSNCFSGGRHMSPERLNNSAHRALKSKWALSDASSQGFLSLHSMAGLNRVLNWLLHAL